jgi:hypothetical protein
MPEIGTSGSMSGERKRSDGPRRTPSHRASPRLYPSKRQGLGPQTAKPVVGNGLGR